jgi:hypothetical protein
MHDRLVPPLPRHEVSLCYPAPSTRRTCSSSISWASLLTAVIASS